MGGYSEMCPYCERWWTKPQGIGDHVKAKHPERYEHWKSVRQKLGGCLGDTGPYQEDGS